MTARNIIAISENPPGQLQGALLRADVNLGIPNWRQSYPLQLTAPPLPALSDLQHVTQYGTRIRDALLGHPVIQLVLNQVFTAPPGHARTLCFEIHAPAGESIRWEVLCDAANQFLATQERCRVGRIADDMYTQDLGYRPFRFPLRLAAFVSAAQIDASEQCRALLASVRDARNQGLDIELHLYIGQRALLDDLTQNSSGRGFHYATMPATDIEVGQQLDKLQPEFVHFFCHGFSQLGSQNLQLSTLNDHDRGLPEGSVVLNMEALLNARTGLRNTWLVVLNCCEGARAAQDLNSMTFQVVARGGIPAAIGMIEPIAAGDADIVCAALYPALFSLVKHNLNDAQAKGIRSVELDLTAVLGPTRRALFSHHHKVSAKGDRWTLPVLYLHPERLYVQLQGGTEHAVDDAESTQDEIDAMRERISVIANFLRSLPPSTPVEVRQQALAVLDLPPPVPREFRPDSDGRLAPSN